MKFKKLVAAGLAAAMMTGMLAGCGSSGGSDDTSGSDNGTEASAEDVTIWYYWETEGHQVALDKVIEDYNNYPSRTLKSSFPSALRLTSSRILRFWIRRITLPMLRWEFSRI